MPKALVIDTDNRRRGRSKPADVEVDVERNLLFRVLLHSPKDTLAGCVALAAVIAIVANATFMQTGHHPAPMFNTSFPNTGLPMTPAAPTAVPPPASASPQQSLLPRPRPAEAEVKASELKQAEIAPAIVKVAPAPAAGLRPPASIPTHSDPVGDLIVSTRRIANVQRALTEFGYGQLKPTGVVGTDTQAAITKFEHDRKLPVTGQMSDRLVRELSAMTGRTID